MACRESQGLLITNGPGKSDLMLALFEGKEVEFSTDQVTDPEFCRLIVRVNGMEIKEGSRQGWLVKGYIIPSDRSQPWQEFEGRYDLRTRRGWFGW